MALPKTYPGCLALTGLARDMIDNHVGWQRISNGPWVVCASLAVNMSWLQGHALMYTAASTHLREGQALRLQGIHDVCSIKPNCSVSTCRTLAGSEPSLTTLKLPA